MVAVRAWRLCGGTGEPVPALVDVGLACCTLEFEAALAQYPDAEPTTVDRLPIGTHQLVVVSGTVTNRLSSAVLAVIDACRGVGPVQVVAFGACASSGGPYWDSYAVTNGIDQLVDVSASVAGCPPPPDALHTVVRRWLPTVGTRG